MCKKFNKKERNLGQWITHQNVTRDRIFKRLRSPGIDSKELIPPAYVAWRAGTITLFLLGFPSPHRLFKNSTSAFYDALQRMEARRLGPFSTHFWLEKVFLPSYLNNLTPSASLVKKRPFIYSICM